jgi:hypothetical protein
VVILLLIFLVTKSPHQGISLPVPSSFKVQTPMRLLNRDAHVSELIDGDTRWWNISFVHEVFLKEEAYMICGIPICLGSQNDRLV